MSLRDRIDACKGLDPSKVADAFVSDNQDEVTREIMTLIGERTAAGALPTTPFVVRHTMYGDADVSDWLLSYADGRFDVSPAPPDATSNGHVRWEHWEDAVRLLNGDTTEVSLHSARRIADVLSETTPGAIALEGRYPLSRAVHAWFGALTLGGTPPDQRHAVIMTRLRNEHAKGRSARNAYVSSVGFAKIAEARSVIACAALVDSGARDDLEGSFLRWEIASDPPVGVQCDFAPVSALQTVRMLSRDEIGTEDADGGVAVRVDSADAFLALVCNEETLVQQLVAGKTRLFGSAKRLENFRSALGKISGQ